MPSALHGTFHRPTLLRASVLLGCILAITAAGTLSADDRRDSNGAAATASVVGETGMDGDRRGGKGTARTVGWIVGGLVLLWLAIRMFEQKLSRPDEEDVETEDESWELGDEYPYCTEPPAAESFTWDLREPVDLTAALLRQLEWKRFEELVCGYYEAVGLAAQPTRTGGRGGVDINLYEPDGHRPKAYVQCKAWVDPAVAAKLLQALSAAMAADGVMAGEFVTAGEFPEGIHARAEAQSILMIDGVEFVTRFMALPIEHRDRLLRHVLRDDFRTPTCPNCEIKMVLQTADTGGFWRCPHFPRCQRQITMRAN